MPVLQLESVTTNYRILRGWVKAAENVSFEVEKGQALGLVGESGCGKTTIALSILKILPPGGRIRSGKIIFDGTDIVPFDDAKMRKIRWKGISIVFQGAMNALNPVFKVGDQIVEAIRLHEPSVSKSEAHSRAESLLEMVGVDASRVNNYPHEFSGGMRQRALIAMALASNPKLLIADEPGTALDVIVQAQVLQLMRALKEKLGLEGRHNVCRSNRGVWRDRDNIQGASSSIHSGSDGSISQHKGRTQKAHLHTRPATRSSTPAKRVQVQSTMPIRHGPLQGRGPGVEEGRPRSLCLLLPLLVLMEALGFER